MRITTIKHPQVMFGKLFWVDQLALLNCQTPARTDKTIDVIMNCNYSSIIPQSGSLPNWYSPVLMLHLGVDAMGKAISINGVF